MPDAESILIRHPLLTGHQQIEGLWFPCERFDEGERTRLVLDHWQTGASVHRFAEGDLLRFREPVALLCETLTGWPLILQGRALCSALLHPEETQRLPAADVWWVRGSQRVALHWRNAELLAPGKWFDVNGYALMDTYDCHSAMPEPAAGVPLLQADVRNILGGALRPASPEREGMIQALLERQRNAAAPPADTERPVTTPGKVPPLYRNTVSTPVFLGSGAFMLGMVIWLMEANHALAQSSNPPPMNLPPPDVIGLWLATALLLACWCVLQRYRTSWLAKRVFQLVANAAFGCRWLVSSTRDSHLAGLYSRRLAAIKAAALPLLAPRALPYSPKPAFWRRWLTRLTRNSRLAELYSKRQAAYMRRMLEMFEQGELEEALRHAIPLGVEQAAAEQAFGLPKRRETLALNGQAGQARSMQLEHAMQAHLKQLYRHTFERLDREGRLEEAVFVLAELLNAHQEALDYLEKHARFPQAAELALAWNMPAATIIRLLCLAGNWQRALQVARRDNTFAYAVAMLRKTWPEHADRLHLEWALTLTAKGLWLQAVDVIWSLPTERERAAQWLLAAEAAGGRLAIRALAKRAILLPDTLLAYGPWVDQLRNDPKRFMERAALAEALLEHKTKANELAWLAGATVHAIIADYSDGHMRLHPNELQQLVDMSNDKLLKADLPIHALQRLNPADQPLEQVKEPLQLIPPAMGGQAICDAVPLEDARYLLALGEAGALVVDATGKTVFHFPTPAHRIVLGHSRQVALALAQRGEVWRISKLDLVNRTAKDLGTLALDAFADTFDGTDWTVASGRQLRVVDVDQRFAVSWQVSDLSGRVSSIKADAQNESVLLANPVQGNQLWHYRLPAR